MTYALTIDQKPTYLHAIVTGRNSRGHVSRYLEDILQECRARRCFRVLIEERLEGPRLGTLEVLEIVAAGSRRALRVFKAITYVDVNAEGDLMQFAETVAEAEKWLLDNACGGAEPHAAADADTPRR